MKAILTFHSIDDSGSVLSYSQTQLVHLLKALDRDGIPIVDMPTFLQPSTQHGVVLTFDDGMHSVFSDALPVLKDYGACAHLFITTGAINSDEKWPRRPSDVPAFKMLDWGQIESLHEAGVVIDAHTESHPDMRKLSESELTEDCEKADEEIAQRLGRRPEFFAYPFGYHNVAARNFCRTRYRASVTTELRSCASREDSAALPRLDTYYLRTPWMADHLSGFTARAYLRLRWLLRTVRGSHCIASYTDSGGLSAKTI